MEQIYTIPVNEAFEASLADGCSCPLCRLFNKVEDSELDAILGDAMMEPDIRIKTNGEGFCDVHYKMMLGRKNRLSMALTLESRLDTLIADLEKSGFFSKDPIVKLDALEKSCYLCSKIDFHFSRMSDCVVYLWRKDPDFAEKFASVRFFCLPHANLLLKYAAARLNKKDCVVFRDLLIKKEVAYLKELKEDVSWFCKKFDYRYTDEPWKNSKDAVERAVKFLRSELHTAPGSVKKEVKAND